MTAPVIAGYTFVEHLGSGGFADVYAYEQEWPQQKVAVKVVRADVALNDRERALFTSEANAMARLGDHPNIVPVLTAGVTADNRPFLVMRYCPPPDLGVRVRHSPLSVADAISTGIKLASAVETAHRAGTVHRDIKPSNVLVTSYHEPALTDFGIAGRLQEVAADDEVRISYPWSPPEMLDGRSNGSVASDVYSLGATIWHLLVGRSPFSITGGDNSARALSARILHAAPPATQRADVPAALDRLLQQTMAKQPAHRPRARSTWRASLQRLEAAAGFPRTQIAVEGDRAPVVAPAPGRRLGRPRRDAGQAGQRRLRLRHRASSERGGVSAAPATDESDAPARLRARRLIWTAIGVAAIVVLMVLVFTGGPPTHPDAPGPTDAGRPQHTGRRRPRGPRRPTPTSTASAPRRGCCSALGRAPTQRPAGTTRGSGSGPRPARAGARGRPAGSSAPPTPRRSACRCG